MKKRIAILIGNAVVVSALALLAHAVEAATPGQVLPATVSQSATATMEHFVALGDAAWEAGDATAAADAYGTAYAIAVVDLPDSRARVAYAHILQRIGHLGAYPAPAGTGYLTAAMGLSQLSVPGAPLQLTEADGRYGHGAPITTRVGASVPRG